MTLKDFFDLLYPYREAEQDIDDVTGQKQKLITKTEFVINLINSITIGEVYEINKEYEDKQYISKERAIITHSPAIVNIGLDVKKFEKYVKTLIKDNEMLDKLLFDPILEKCGIELSPENYASELANIFENLLRKHAEEKTKNSDRSNPDAKPYSYNAILAWLDRMESNCQNAMDLSKEFMNSEYYKELNINYIFSFNYGFVVRASKTLKATKEAMRKAVTSNKIRPVIVHDFQKMINDAWDENNKNLKDTDCRIFDRRSPEYSQFERVYIALMDLSYEISCFEHMDILNILAGKQK